MNKIKDKLTVIVVAMFLFSFSFFIWLKPSDEMSVSERRYLKQFPELNAETLFGGKFMKEFETYTLDQFPNRDGFRGIKSATAQYVFGQKDVNDLYLEDNHIVYVEYPENSESLHWAAERFKYVYDKYLLNSQTKVYFSIIPDKNYYLADKSDHLTIDYDSFITEMVQMVPFMEYIDITDSLSIDDYYYTDSHWKQNELLQTASVLAEGMGFDIVKKYDKIVLDEAFYGVYHGQMALPLKADELTYLNNDMLDKCIVYDHQNDKQIPMYDLQKINGKDPYEMFLGGPLSLVTIENPNAERDKELIIFRDSFGSSIAPLLVEGYKKVTLIDIRYIQSSALDRYIEFDEQDVLFLYSTSVLNNSKTIK